MKKRKKSLLRRYFVFSMTFGILMGAVFPFFAGIFTEYKEPSYYLPFTLLCILAGIIVGLVAYLIGRMTILYAVDQLSLHMKRLSETYDITEEMIIASEDRLGAIARNFNQFTGNLNDLLGEIKTSFHGTRESTEEIGKATEAVTVAADQIQAGLEGTLLNFSQFDESVRASLQGIDVITLSIRKIAGMIREETRGLTDFSAALGENTQTVSRLAELTTDRRRSMDSLKASLESGADKMRDLSRLIALLDTNTVTVTRSLEVINDITDRTALLSMNAAIEAARAGVQGKGFAVLAQEIKKLSSQTEVNSREIQEALKETSATIREMTGTGADLDGAFLRIETETKVVNQALEEMLNSIEMIEEKDNGLLKVRDQLNTANEVILDHSARIDDSLHGLSDSHRNFRDLSLNLRADMQQVSEQVQKIVSRMDLLETQSGINGQLNRKLGLSLEIFKTGSDK